jgi:hypothetical protein
LTMVIALANLVNRINDTLQIEVDSVWKILPRMTVRT